MNTLLLQKEWSYFKCNENRIHILIDKRYKWNVKKCQLFQVN